MLSPAENSLWIPLLCRLGVSFGIHDTKMAQPCCSVSGLYGVNYTDGRVWYGTRVQPSPLCSYLGLVLHYYLYYSSMYNVCWGLILLCHSWDGQVVSEQKNLRSKINAARRCRKLMKMLVNSCRSAVFIEGSSGFKCLFSRIVQSWGCPSLLPFACSQ